MDAMWRVVLALAVLAAAQARDDFRPCARVHSVSAGETGFTVRVEFERVRALRCMMRIPITHVPAQGTRYGPRAGAVCEADGLGCVALAEPTVVVVDSDIPTYERALEELVALPSFDTNSRTVPFMHMPAQLADAVGSKLLPRDQWVSRFFGLDLNALSGRALSYLMAVQQDMLVAVVSEFSPLLDAGDESIAPRMRMDKTRVVPAFSPLDVSDFVLHGARVYSPVALADVVPHSLPWLNDTYVMKHPFRAVSPMYKELLATDAAFVAAMEAGKRAGLSELDVIASMMAANASFPPYAEDVEVLFGDVPAQDAVNASNTTLLFPEPTMTIRHPIARVLGCLSADDWQSVLGTSTASWAPPDCAGSTQCSVAGVMLDKPNSRMRRAAPHHLSSADACDTLRPKRAHAETARVRVGAAVEVDGNTVAKVTAVLELTSRAQIHHAQADGLLLSVATDAESVPRLIHEPAEGVYLMNCFAGRWSVPDATDEENPYLDEPAYTAPSALERQRGTMILSAADKDKVLGSGCGGMNFGMGFWRHFANRVVHGTFSAPHAGPDLLNGTHAKLLHKLEHEPGSIMDAFHTTGTSCVPGARCKAYSPCSLLREELRWMRYHGRLPPVVPPFNASEPNLYAPYPAIPAFPDTPLQQPGKPIAGRLKVQQPNKARRVGFGCAPNNGGTPTTLDARLWQPMRMNMWVASNRMGAAPRLRVEDTHTAHARRISRGVSYTMTVDVPWARVNHTHVSTQVTGCVYMPITTRTASPDLACRDVRPALAGTAYANVPRVDAAPAALVLVVECAGVAFCPVWDASLATLIDADTGEAVPATVTYERDFAPYAPAPALRLAESRLRANMTPGDGFAAGVPFEALADYAGHGAPLATHLVFRFWQNVTARRYIWEAHGTDAQARKTADFYSRAYAAQLFVGGTGVAVVNATTFDCHSAVDCKLRPDVPALCRPPTFGFDTELRDLNVEPDNPCKCGFFDPKCQYRCGSLVLWWTVLGVVELVILVGAAVYFIHIRGAPMG